METGKTRKTSFWEGGGEGGGGAKVGRALHPNGVVRVGARKWKAPGVRAVFLLFGACSLNRGGVSGPRVSVDSTHSVL